MKLLFQSCKILFYHMSWHLTTRQILISFTISIPTPMKLCFYKLVSCFNCYYQTLYTLPSEKIFSTTFAWRVLVETKNVNEKMFSVVGVAVLLCGSGIKSLKMHWFALSVVNINFSFFIHVYLLLYPGLLTGIEGTKFLFLSYRFSLSFPRDIPYVMAV